MLSDMAYFIAIGPTSRLHIYICKAIIQQGGGGGPRVTATPQITQFLDNYTKNILVWQSSPGRKPLKLTRNPLRFTMSPLNSDWKLLRSSLTKSAL